MSEREKIELGIYIMEKVTDYSYEDCEDFDELMNEILNNLKYELDLLDYREKRKKEESLKDNETTEMKMGRVDEMLLRILNTPEEEISDIDKEIWDEKIFKNNLLYMGSNINSIVFKYGDYFY